MSSSSDEETDISESELTPYVEKVYRKLKDGYYRTKLSNGMFKCPFCGGRKRKDYTYRDILQHTESRGRSSGSREGGIKQQGQHKALANYLEKYHGRRGLRAVTRSLNNLIKEKDEVVQAHNKERRRMQKTERELLERIMKEHEEAMLRLESKNKKLEQTWKEVKAREAHNDSLRRKLAHERKMIELAMEQKKADKKMLELAESLKRQKEKLHQKIIDLEKKLDQEQALE